VLEDVGDTGVIFRNRRKENREGVVVVRALDVDVPGSCALVFELQVGAVEPVQALPAQDRISTNGSDAARTGSGHIEV
jgi:hypothetical protein